MGAVNAQTIPATQIMACHGKGSIGVYFWQNQLQVATSIFRHLQASCIYPKRAVVLLTHVRIAMKSTKAISSLTVVLDLSERTDSIDRIIKTIGAGTFLDAKSFTM